MSSKIVKSIVHAPHLTNAGKPAPKPKELPRRGLGDVVALVAKPIARTVDKLTGSTMENCQPCSMRQTALNKMVPDVLKPFRRK